MFLNHVKLLLILKMKKQDCTLFLFPKGLVQTKSRQHLMHTMEDTTCPSLPPALYCCLFTFAGRVSCQSTSQSASIRLCQVSISSLNSLTYLILTETRLGKLTQAMQLMWTGTQKTLGRRNLINSWRQGNNHLASEPKKEEQLASVDTRLVKTTKTTSLYCRA